MTMGSCSVSWAGFAYNAPIRTERCVIKGLVNMVNKKMSKPSYIVCTPIPLAIAPAAAVAAIAFAVALVK